jgi:hypothetical protein
MKNQVTFVIFLINSTDSHSIDGLRYLYSSETLRANGDNPSITFPLPSIRAKK